ncbi:MAG: hypothetical protein K9L29_03260 [Spirochaetales bacterium]|nr:hypothetical protein [Spirochaetales bacterium]
MHRWSAQLNKQIDDFLGELGPEDVKTTCSIISNSFLESSASKEQLVLSMVLLNKLGQGNLRTAELLYELLKGRLDNSDQSFLRYQLFDDKRPLPDDITYDIINRPYLSFKRAISQGIKIEKVTSRFSPNATAFYLTMIFCRVDLNEQNRAMLSFLLSRIESDLPENVIQGIFVYLRNLKNIIREIEGKGDKALTEEFHYADEPDMRKPSDYAARSARESEEKTGSDGDSISRRQKPVGSATKRDNEMDAASIEEGATVTERDRFSPEQAESEEQSERVGRYSGESPSADKEQTERSDLADSAEQTEGDTDQEQRTDRGDNAYIGSERESERQSPFDRNEAKEAAIQAAETEGKSGSRTDGDVREAGEESASQKKLSSDYEAMEGERTPSGTNAKEAKDSQYTIHFSRNTEELLKIIDDLETEDQPAGAPGSEQAEEPERKPGTQPEPEPAPESPSTDTGRERTAERGRDEGGGRPARRKRSMLFTAGGAAAAVVLGVVLFTGIPAKDGGGETGSAGGGTIDEAQAPGTESAGAVGGAETAAGESGEAAAGQTPAASDFQISSSDSGPLWSVNEGETTWQLFQTAKAGGVSVSGGGTYSVPAEVSWMEFVMDVFAANPGLDQFNLVFPGQDIRLPVY